MAGLRWGVSLGGGNGSIRWYPIPAEGGPDVQLGEVEEYSHFLCIFPVFQDIDNNFKS